MTDRNNKPISFYVLQILVVFQGLSGLAGGIGLLMDSTGKSLQIPSEWLTGSPFSTYLVPGLILLIVLGIFPLFVFYGLLKKTKWAWLACIVLGFALLIWIIVEIMVIGYHAQPPLQLIYGLAGLTILLLTLSKNVKQYCKE